MNPIFKNTLAVIIGLFVGSVVNMAIILMSSSIIPPPKGADVTTMEGLKATIHLFQPRHFIFPFVAHALGTFAGAATTAVIAANNTTKFALAIGAFFLLGGIINVFTLPSPIWYSIIDVVFAYLPMAYMGKKLVASKAP
ncbi:hypothetical protein B0A67_05000 [Flavobacterium aquidurense]|jgi:hypothetical protein|uniref:hypothetical protein n=1 Tax=Flavobacterium aquidurense TaxID=362413 RepID=UPI000916CFAE|nr:hypothetical protein [Flavobacterium aquidurense]OXA73230.1 hypothetical protein B0A67_05000 [Flavobacterium aquidurense]SHG87461.1 hypothetical protein SAMN05444481_108160 [Flavobacterium frigidimaris]